jgi:hypothetical protein
MALACGIVAGGLLAVVCDRNLRRDEHLSEVQVALCFYGLVAGWLLAGASVLVMAMGAST